MIVFKRRLFFWLVKAYLKKWGKRILLFFLIGIVISYFLFTRLYSFFSHIALHKKESIGIVGSFTPETLPPQVLADVSEGLTVADASWNIKPGLAKSWKIQDSGKTYIFTLNTNMQFTDGHHLTSSDVSYNFSDATVVRPTLDVIVFKLKDTYSPFLLSVSRPLFKDGFTGVGPYKVTDIKLNGNFVQTITLTAASDPYKTKKYSFYPTTDALKTAFLLGEVGTAENLPDLSIKSGSIQSTNSVSISKSYDYTHLVTLFYNTVDPVLSDKKIRLALSYALPDKFAEGIRNYTPYPPTSFAYTNLYDGSQDFDHAKLLLDGSSASDSGTLKLTIKTLPKYQSVAKEVSSAWAKVGIRTSIVTTLSVPSDYQIFLGDFLVPSDPDQYMLWHSKGDYNITNYRTNLRIDKLLEDGRKTVSATQAQTIDDRRKIYLDFQKYLLEDAPASFLFFPNSYTVTRS